MIFAPPAPKWKPLASAAAVEAADAAEGAPNATAGQADRTPDVDVVDGAHWVPSAGAERSALGRVAVPVRYHAACHRKRTSLRLTDPASRESK